MEKEIMEAIMDGAKSGKSTTLADGKIIVEGLGDNEISPKIRPNQETDEEQILKIILDNTEKIKKEVTKKEETVVKIKDEKKELEDELEKRKEQLRESQKNFRKIGCSFRDDVADRFEELAHKLNYQKATAMVRSYLLLLLENEEFQRNFVEFQELQKEESRA